MAFRARCSVLILAVTVVVFSYAPPVLAEVHSLFDLVNPAGSPFPTDRFTVIDDRNITGLRVALPLPDCNTNPSDCQDLQVVNTLDGFNVNPQFKTDLKERQKAAKAQ